MWDGCGDALKKRFNSLHKRVVKLIFPDTNLTTEHGKKERFFYDNDPTKISGIQGPCTNKVFSTEPLGHNI